MPAECPEDALHIAVAAVNGIEVIITWNFAHLNNPFTRKKVRQIVEGEGFECPEICSPEELLEVDKLKPRSLRMYENTGWSTHANSGAIYLKSAPICVTLKSLPDIKSSV